MYTRFLSLLLMTATLSNIALLTAMEQPFHYSSMEWNVTAEVNLRAENETYRQALAQKVNTYLALLRTRINTFKARNFSPKTNASLSKLLDIYEHNTGVVTKTLSLSSHERINIKQLSEFCDDIGLLVNNVENSEISEEELLTTLICNGFIAEESASNN